MNREFIITSKSNNRSISNSSNDYYDYTRNDRDLLGDRGSELGRIIPRDQKLKTRLEKWQVVIILLPI